MNRTTLASLIVGIGIGAVGATALIARRLHGDRYVVIDMERLRNAHEQPDVHQ